MLTRLKEFWHWWTLTRLKKLWRWCKGKGEYDLTAHESFVLTQTLRTLSNPNLGWQTGKPYDAVNLQLWNVIMHQKDRPDDLNERNLDTVMRALSAKILKQHDYD